MTHAFNSPRWEQERKARMGRTTDRNMLTDAIIGKGFPTIDFALKMTKHGLARFNGNQHNESWVWDRAALEKLDLEILRSLYPKP